MRCLRASGLKTDVVSLFEQFLAERHLKSDIRFPWCVIFTCCTAKQGQGGTYEKEAALRSGEGVAFCGVERVFFYQSPPDASTGFRIMNTYVKMKCMAERCLAAADALNERATAMATAKEDMVRGRRQHAGTTAWRSIACTARWTPRAQRHHILSIGA